MPGRDSAAVCTTSKWLIWLPMAEKGARDKPRDAAYPVRAACRPSGRPPCTRQPLVSLDWADSAEQSVVCSQHAAETQSGRLLALLIADGDSRIDRALCAVLCGRRLPRVAHVTLITCSSVSFPGRSTPMSTSTYPSTGPSEHHEIRRHSTQNAATGSTIFYVYTLPINVISTVGTEACLHISI
jgi:hypothetical protein